MPLRRVVPLVYVLGLLACPSGGDTDTTAPETSTTDANPNTSTTSTGGVTTGPDTPTTSDASEDSEDSGHQGHESSSTGSEPVCGAGGVDSCCCFSVQGEVGHGVVSISCEAADSGCEAPQATCPEDQVTCTGADLTVTSVEGLDCLLKGLGAGTPGRYSWDITSGDGLAGSSHSLYVRDDGTAFVSSYEYHELEYSYTAVERRTLADSGFFKDCAAAPTPGEQFECLAQATAGEAAETCLEGFSGTAGRR